MLATGTPFKPSRNRRDVGTGYHIDSWSARHYHCSQEPQLFQFNSNFDFWRSRDRLSLSPIRTCRLIYRECRRLPYAGNTFLFRNPSTFQAFSSSVRPEGVRAIQEISLPVAVGSAPFSPARSRAWASTIWDYGLTGQFTNLKELRVTLELYFPRDILFIGNRKPNYRDCKEEVGISGNGNSEQYTNWLDQLARLGPDSRNDVEPRRASSSPSPITPTSLRAQPVKFEVMVCDDPLSMWGPIGQIQYCRDNRIRDVSIWMSEREVKCLTVEQKQKLAKEIEERMVKRSEDTQHGKAYNPLPSDNDWPHE
ncbi:Canalicular multispecific organic anion transporter 1 [Venturia nashicola]|uniref:Canalicular multispecific organic anion transporter 1 n=1 Tax=Venturia nashicola TaxID=86259 RepID=A0A4Z1P934_9PEZI|nr:Canalicular multispecific organic anion transporter 1 [Venturia nashicola]